MKKALENSLRKQFLKKTNEEYAYIKADPELWRLEIEEQAEWDTTLQDGLSI